MLRDEPLTVRTLLKKFLRPISLTWIFDAVRDCSDGAHSVVYRFRD